MFMWVWVPDSNRLALDGNIEIHQGALRLRASESHGLRHGFDVS